MAEIREVVSESLQATIRRLLPSQRGFTEDLQASNVITPIIDLTPTAEGSILPSNLQYAMGFGNAEVQSTSNTTTSLATVPGFYRLNSFINIAGGAGTRVCNITITDGTTTRTMLSYFTQNTVSGNIFESFEGYFFVGVGETLQQTSNNLGAQIRTTTRQVADVYGNLVDPLGFSPQ